MWKPELSDLRTPILSLWFLHMIPSFLFTCFCASFSSQTPSDSGAAPPLQTPTKLHRSARLCHSNASPALKALISWITIARPAVQTIRFPYMECHLSSCVPPSKSCIMLGGTPAKEDWKLGISDSVEEAPAACCRPGCLSQGSPPVTALYLLPFGSQPSHTHTHRQNHTHTHDGFCTNDHAGFSGKTGPTAAGRSQFLWSTKQFENK